MPNANVLWFRKIKMKKEDEDDDEEGIKRNVKLD